MPLYHCNHCHHEWEAGLGLGPPAPCAWCGEGWTVLAETTPLERSIKEMMKMGRLDIPTGRRVRCINTIGYEVSLQKGKIYSVVSSPDDEQYGLIAVIDETGQRYLFSASRFEEVKED